MYLNRVVTFVSLSYMHGWFDLGMAPFSFITCDDET